MILIMFTDTNMDIWVSRSINIQASYSLSSISEEDSCSMVVSEGCVDAWVDHLLRTVDQSNHASRSGTDSTFATREPYQQHRTR